MKAISRFGSRAGVLAATMLAMSLFVDNTPLLHANSPGPEVRAQTSTRWTIQVETADEFDIFRMEVERTGGRSFVFTQDGTKHDGGSGAGQVLSGNRVQFQDSFGSTYNGFIRSDRTVFGSVTNYFGESGNFEMEMIGN